MKEIIIKSENLIGEEEWYGEVFKCPACKSKHLKNGDNYCPNCGNKLIWNLNKSKEELQAEYTEKRQEKLKSIVGEMVFR
jgi:uncharacterized Zn finger protein (UPF0148 family)